MMGEMRGQVQGDLYTAITQMRTEWSQSAHLMLNAAQQVPQQQVQPHQIPPVQQVQQQVQPQVTQQATSLVEANLNLPLMLPDPMSVEEISSDEEGFQ
eukprot:3017131-Amphidinium_carterae.1